MKKIQNKQKITLQKHKKKSNYWKYGHPTIRRYLESKSKFGQGTLKGQKQVGGEGGVKLLIKESISKESEGLSLGTKDVSPISISNIIESSERGKSSNRTEVIHRSRDQGRNLSTVTVDGSISTESTWRNLRNWWNLC